jgi:hypothetical protein
LEIILKLTGEHTDEWRAFLGYMESIMKIIGEHT